MSISYTVADTTIEASTEPDLFSPKGLDQGSRLLLGCLSKFEYSSLLDWGCGWGAIALFAAKKSPQAQVIAIDSDIAAVETTRQNTKLNALANLDVIASHGYSELSSDQSFDIIASNPPTHRGREVVDKMIADSQTRLNPGGVILLVVEARIKPWVARQLKATYGDYKIVKRSTKHVVLMATK